MRSPTKKPYLTEEESTEEFSDFATEKQELRFRV
jgi:hypothetical protein